MGFLCCGGDASGDEDSGPAPGLMDLRMEATAAMAARYPRAPRTKLVQLAERLPDWIAADPNIVIIGAAICKEWGILHELIEAGCSPNRARPADAYKPMHTWIKKRLDEDSAAFNSNSVLVISAYEGDLTVLRYLVARRERLGITGLGMALAPVVCIYGKNVADAFWLLDHLPLSEDEFADAAGHVMDAVVSFDMADAKVMLAQRLAVRTLARRFAASKRVDNDVLFSLYAALPGALHVRMDDVALDADTAMMLKHPPEDLGDVGRLAKSVSFGSAEDTGLLVQLAALLGEWRALHTLVAAGSDPRESDSFPTHSHLDDISRILAEDWEYRKGNYMAATAAHAGNLTAVRYILAHGAQLGVSDMVKHILPMAAERGNHSGACIWLLDNLGLDDVAWEKAARLATRAASGKGNMGTVALIFERLRSRDVDLEAFVCCVFEPSISYIGIIKAVIWDTWIPEKILFGAALDTMPYASRRHCRLTYAVLKRFTVNYATEAYESGVPLLARAVDRNDAAGARKALSAIDSDTDMLHLAATSAIRLSATKKRYATFCAVLDHPGVVQHHLREHWAKVLRDATDARDPAYVLEVLKRLPRGVDGLLLSGIKQALQHTLAEARIRDAIPLLTRVASEPDAETLLSNAVITTSIYGDADDLELVLGACAGHLGSGMLASTIVGAMEQAHGDDTGAKFAALIQVARRDPVVYSLALRTGVVTAAVIAEPDIVAQVCLTGEWRDDERRDALTAAAAAAAAENDLSTLERVLAMAGPLPADVRVRWKVGSNTWRLALKDIGADDLLAAQTAAAEDDSGPNYTTVHYALENSRLTAEQHAIFSANEARREAHLARTQRHEDGIDEAQLGRVATVLDAETNSEAWQRAADELCVICCDPLLTSARSGAVGAQTEAEPRPIDAPQASSGDSLLQGINLGDAAPLSAKSDVVVEIGVDRAADCAPERTDDAIDAAPDMLPAPCPQTPLASEALQDVVQIACPGRHLMHKECVLAWFGKSRLCPTCKHNLAPLL